MPHAGAALGGAEDRVPARIGVDGMSQRRRKGGQGRRPEGSGRDDMNEEGRGPHMGDGGLPVPGFGAASAARNLGTQRSVDQASSARRFFAVAARSVPVAGSTSSLKSKH